MIILFTEWADEPRPSSNILRLIYQGRFLHGNITLAGNFLHIIYTIVHNVSVQEVLICFLRFWQFSV